MDELGKTIKYYIVAADALPEIFIKVAEAKRMMQTGEVDTVGEATKRAGISRSAFYKYKDSVQPFNDMKSEHIITFYAMLKDTAGVLSRVLSVFASSGANILTINQYSSFFYIVKSGNQINNRTLSGTCRTYQCHALACLYRKGYVL